MASLVLKNLRTWVGGFDFTGESNQGGLDLDHEVLDDTRFQPVGSGGARQRQCGLEDVSATTAGLWSAGAGSVDENAFSLNGALDEPYTVSPDGLEGSVAYMLRTGRFKYSLFGANVGQLAPFSVDFKGTAGETAVVRGLVTKTRSTVAATGATGTGVQLPAVGAGQFLYAGLHVFSAGTTITAVVESAPTNAFGANTTRITFGPITTVGGYWGTRVAGPVTDTWYRLRITAITGSFNVAAIVGVK